MAAKDNRPPEPKLTGPQTPIAQRTEQHPVKPPPLPSRDPAGTPIGAAEASALSKIRRKGARE